MDQRTASPSATVLRHLAQPADPVRVTAALLGLTERVARQLVGSWIGASPEAERLLAAMPHIVRSLAIATTDRPERCHGELRGPVLWSETMSARSATAGDPGLFVCATTTRAYDTDENRVLKAALAAVARAGAHSEVVAPLAGPDQETVRRARQHGQAANHLLEHRTLADVPAVAPRGRALQRTRAGNRRGTYAPAVALLQRAQHPWPAGALDALADPEVATRIDHLAVALGRWRAHPDGGPLALRTSAGRLVAGAVRYDALEGVRVGDATVHDASGVEAAVDRLLSAR